MSDKSIYLDLSKPLYDFDNLGVTGVEKDCGLLIFEYESPVDNHIVIRAALQLSFEKIRAKFLFMRILMTILRGDTKILI